MFTIIAVMLADLIGYSLLVPIYPLIREYYHISDLQMGYFVQIWAVFLCIGGIFFGILSDKTSRRTGLVIPMLGSVLTYLVAFWIDDYWTLLVVRAFNGFFNGNFVVAMAASADISTPENRLKNMAAIGAALSLSWIVGPLVGGLVSFVATNTYFNIHFPFLLSAAFSFFGFLLTLWYFPKITRPVAVIEKAKAQKNIWKDFKDTLFNRKMMFYTVLSILFMAMLAGSQVYFSLWLSEVFHFSSSEIGVIWGVLAVAALSGQITINKFLHKTNTHTLIVIGFVGMGVSYFVLAFSGSATVILLFAFLLFYTNTFVQAGISTRVSLSGYPEQMGLVFGINQAFSSLGRVIAPSLLGLLVTVLGYRPAWFVFGVVFILLAIALPLIFISRWLEK